MKKIAVFFLTLTLFWTPLHADGSYIVISGNDAMFWKLKMNTKFARSPRSQKS